MPNDTTGPRNDIINPTKRLKALHRKHGAGLSLKKFAAGLRDAKDNEASKFASDWFSRTSRPKAKAPAAPVMTKKAEPQKPMGRGAPAPAARPQKPATKR